MDNKYEKSLGLLAFEHCYLPVLQECGSYSEEEENLAELLVKLFPDFPEIESEIVCARNFQHYLGEIPSKKISTIPK